MKVFWWVKASTIVIDAEMYTHTHTMPPHIQSLHAHTRTHTAIQLSLNESQAPPPSLYPSFPTASTSSTPKPQAVKSEVSFWSISAVYSCPNFFLFLFSLSPILPSPPFCYSSSPPSYSSSPFSLSFSSLSPPLPSLSPSLLTKGEEGPSNL